MSTLTIGREIALPAASVSSTPSVPQAKSGIKPNVYVGTIGVYFIDILAATSLAVPLEAWYVEHLSWRWLFWHSALITPLMMLCIYRAIPHPPPRTGPKPSLSWRGFLYASLGLSLIYGVLD